MTEREPFPFKRGAVTLLLGVIWMATAYVVFVGAVCLWVGMCNTSREGFWMPLLVGGLTVATALRLAFPLASGLRSALREKEEAQDLDLSGRV